MQRIKKRRLEEILQQNRLSVLDSQVDLEKVSMATELLELRKFWQQEANLSRLRNE